MPEQTHIFFKPGKSTSAPILMLHGTGGDEQDLSKIVSYLAPDSPQLGIRGRLVENGQTRYFTHTQDGGFDLVSLSQETDWLLDTIAQTASKYELNTDEMIVVGYSNGANVAAYALLEKQATFKTGILFHPMLLKPTQSLPNLSQVKVWGSHGAKDPIVAKANFVQLMQTLQQAHAEVTIFEHQQFHNINEQELESAKKWLTPYL
ncbi:alpha/beta hydrolase [Pediococcus cellicola]|uniref:Dienelactone hydrolase domain-containing protein n=1 Tax=Pediococcus cellicola TaxID=319652 RepID=A0A0R2IQP8_9LACO|nr:dienelactone hydrolase family protein [Pediococcus cellicola]KRN67504.1 hypothetical protein IV80_GL000043 [Pediococcus cellicola]GEL14510.1 esterase [Pediococcus cellicola]